MDIHVAAGGNLNQVASSAPSFARIWLSGTYTINSPIDYTDKRLQWIGPAFLTGSNLTSMFTSRAGSGHNTFGGGIHHLTFDATALKDGGAAVVLKQVNYFRAEHCAIKGEAGSFKHAYLLNPGSGGTANHNDMSWLTVRDCEAFNACLLNAPATDACFNGWYMADILCHSDTPATHSYMFVDNCIKGLTIMRPVMRNSKVPTIHIDNRGVSKNRTVNIIDPTFTDLQSYGVELFNTQTAIRHSGYGVIWGDAGVVGYMNVPQSLLAGSLTQGAN